MVWLTMKIVNNKKCNYLLKATAIGFKDAI